MRAFAFGPRRQSCERAHTWISLDLDGELSPFERSLLGAHLDKCAACCAFRADVAALTNELRAAPVEYPERRVEVPSRRHAPFRALQLSAAALAVVAVGLGSLVGSLRSREVIPNAGGIALVSADMDGRTMKDRQRRLTAARLSRDQVQQSRSPGPQVF